MLPGGTAIFLVVTFFSNFPNPCPHPSVHLYPFVQVKMWTMSCEVSFLYGGRHRLLSSKSKYLHRMVLSCIEEAMTGAMRFDAGITTVRPLGFQESDASPLFPYHGIRVL